MGAAATPPNFLRAKGPRNQRMETSVADKVRFIGMMVDATREHAMSSETVTDFTAVDSSKDPQFFARFLDAANRLPTISASKRIILDGLRLRNGARVLDLDAALATTRSRLPSGSARAGG